MKNKTIFLHNNEVVYLFDDTLDDYDTPISKPTLRIENIDGKLFTTLLPRFFIVEDDAQIFHSTDKMNYNFSTADTGENVIVKVYKKTGELGVVQYSHELDCPHMPVKDYQQFIALRASSKFNPKLDRLTAGFAMASIGQSMEYLDIDPELCIEYDHETIIDIIFEQFSKQRRARIKKAAEANEMN